MSCVYLKKMRRVLKTGEKNMKQEQESYKFMREIIKEKPLDPRKMLSCACILIIGGVLFGGIAAFSFAAFFPTAEQVFQREKTVTPVNIPADRGPIPTPRVTPQPTPIHQENEPQEVKSSEIESYKSLYAKLREVAQRAEKSLVTVNGISSTEDWFAQTYENSTQTTGLLVTENEEAYFVLTKYENVENSQRIQLIFKDGSAVDAYYQRHDPITGLTVLKVEKQNIPVGTQLAVAELGNSYGVLQGDPVLAVGTPSGAEDSIAFGTVTSVSNQITVTDADYSLLTTDIIGSKNGSGILVNLDGKVVGIIAQNYGSEEQNILVGMAISQIKELISAMCNNTERPYIGIRGQDVTAKISEQTGIPRGIRITNVESDSPAMLAGIKEMDVITKIGRESTLTLEQYQSELHKYEPGQEVKITGMRQGADGYVEIVFDVIVGTV